MSDTTLWMPPEWEAHERTWMAWPGGGYTLGDCEADADEARATWAAVANAISEFEPVTMLVPSHELAEARRRLAGSILVVEAELDDAWMRDIGPTFVRDGDDLVAVDWVFNGWGAQSWATWGKDARIGARVAELAQVRVEASPLVNEGGGIHVDGRGFVLATRTVQLDPGRNPGLREQDVEAEFARVLGAPHTVWLPRGLTRDSQRFGTRGHVDIVAAFAPDGRLLVHDQRDAEHPDHAVTRDVLDALAAGFDAVDSPREVLRVPAPRTLRDAEGWVDYSYINHLVCNGAVVACTFADAHDDEAFEVLAEAYPGREIVGVDARPLFARGGGIHCITQQQPAA